MDLFRGRRAHHTTPSASSITGTCATCDAIELRSRVDSLAHTVTALELQLDQLEAGLSDLADRPKAPEPTAPVVINVYGSAL